MVYFMHICVKPYDRKNNDVPFIYTVVVTEVITVDFTFFCWTLPAVKCGRILKISQFSMQCDRDLKLSQFSQHEGSHLMTISTENWELLHTLHQHKGQNVENLLNQLSWIYWKFRMASATHPIECKVSLKSCFILA